MFVPDLTLGWHRFTSLWNTCINASSLGVLFFNTVCLWRCAVSSTQSWQPLKSRRGALKLPWLTYRKPCCWIMGHNENVCRQLSISCSSERLSTKCPPDMRIKLLSLCRRFQSQSRVPHFKTQQQIFDVNRLNWLKNYKERTRHEFSILELIYKCWGVFSRLNPTLYPICLPQIRDLPPQDKTDIRPTLVSAGLLLAPDEFQMVLDADDISESTNFP